MTGRSFLYISLSLLGAVAFSVAAIFFSPVNPVLYDPTAGAAFDQSGQGKDVLAENAPAKVPPPSATVTHISTPSAVKAIYMTSFVAGDREWRERLVVLIEETELNSVVIDIKDYTGLVAFKISDPVLQSIASVDERVSDIRRFIADLHERGIYVIGRIAAFQDPALALKRPDLAVKKATDQTIIWKDYKGQSWVDPGSAEVWAYMADIGRMAHEVGFDELNYDYIRFPSDGDMNDIYYPFSEGKIKTRVMGDFFSYLNAELSSTSAALSADLFGMTTTNADDLNVGQQLETALLYFDYVAPMVYPSHYPPNFNEYNNPAEKPYEVVKYSMDKAVARASTTAGKLRPWLQDFSIGTVTYTPEMVKAQIEAVYDSGLNSWMLWNASNRYTNEALLQETDI